MYIKEDLVYNKHSGHMIGSTTIYWPSSVQSRATVREEMKTVMAMMVRGLFTTLRFPFAHFPCEKVTGELLFYPFWEAIYRLERMGLKLSYTFCIA